MKLFQDKVLIRKDPEVEKIGSLFIVEQKNHSEPSIGTVVDCGPGKVFVSPKDGEMEIKGSTKSQVKIGDKVLAQRNTEYPIKVNNEWLLLFKEADIIGVLDEIN